VGYITDFGISDTNNMGAAMAPAAAETLTAFFKDTSSKPDDYDLIITGDLGAIGSDLLRQLMERKGYRLGANYTDCGLIIYDRSKQDVHAGGSGCGCSATVLCSYILGKMEAGELKNVVFVATGALMSPTSSQQGESIPGIAHLCHLVAIE
jgi:stage V sporulation protein AD